MDLKQLRHFVSVASERSFSKAAKLCAISQPALTRSIKLLEARLGVSLFDRSTRRVELTRAGKKMLPRAKLILNEVQETERLLASDMTEVRPLRIGAAPMFTSELLPAAISSFSQQQRDISLDVTTGLFDPLVARLLEAEIDLIFSHLPYVHFDDDVIVEPLIDIEVVYLVSAGHPLATRQNTRFQDLINCPWAVVGETHSEDFYGYILSSQGATASPIRLRSNSLDLLQSIVIHPPWVTLLPRQRAAKALETGQLVELSVAGDSMKRRGGLIYRKASKDNPALTAFANQIRAACAPTTKASLR